MNYAEALGHWYLRLNGFFLLQNFVLHDYNEERCTADADLLGVRMPFISEPVGGQPVDWDIDAFGAWVWRTVSLWACVKGGHHAAGPGNAFEEPRVRQAVDRLGFFTDEDRNAALAALLRGPSSPTVGTLRTPLSDGVNLAVGLRSSIDKSIALQWCCGSRVFVCDNLAFSAETQITRKHNLSSNASAVCRRAGSGCASIETLRRWRWAICAAGF
jgi:hypothetical protein